MMELYSQERRKQEAMDDGPPKPKNPTNLTHTSEARKMLGVYLASEGNNQLQETILLEKTGCGQKTPEWHTLAR